MSKSYTEREVIIINSISLVRKLRRVLFSKPVLAQRVLDSFLGVDALDLASKDTVLNIAKTVSDLIARAMAEPDDNLVIDELVELLQKYNLPTMFYSMATTANTRSLSVFWSMQRDFNLYTDFSNEYLEHMFCEYNNIGYSNMREAKIHRNSFRIFAPLTGDYITLSMFNYLLIRDSGYEFNIDAMAMSESLEESYFALPGSNASITRFAVFSDIIDSGKTVTACYNALRNELPEGSNASKIIKPRGLLE